MYAKCGEHGPAGIPRLSFLLIITIETAAAMIIIMSYIVGCQGRGGAREARLPPQVAPPTGKPEMGKR